MIFIDQTLDPFRYWLRQRHSVHDVSNGELTKSYRKLWEYMQRQSSIETLVKRGQWGTQDEKTAFVMVERDFWCRCIDVIEWSWMGNYNRETSDSSDGGCWNVTAQSATAFRLLKICLNRYYCIQICSRFGHLGRCECIWGYPNRAKCYFRGK